MNFKKIGLLAAALGLVLAVAAFGSNGLRELLSTQIKSAQAGDAPAPETLNLVVSTNGINDASGMVSVINFVPAAELPARAPDAAGLYGGFDGSTLTLQQSFFLAAPNGEGAVMSGMGIVSGAAPVGACLLAPLLLAPCLQAPFNLVRSLFLARLFRARLKTSAPCPCPPNWVHSNTPSA